MIKIIDISSQFIVKVKVEKTGNIFQWHIVYFGVKVPNKDQSNKKVNQNTSQILNFYNNSFELRKNPNVFTTMIKSWSPPPLKVTSTDGKISKRSVWGSTDLYSKYETLRKQMNENGKIDISNKRQHLNKSNTK